MLNLQLKKKANRNNSNIFEEVFYWYLREHFSWVTKIYSQEWMTQRFLKKNQFVEKQDDNQLNTHKCFSRCKVYVFFFCDTTTNFKKSPKIQWKFDYIYDRIEFIFGQVLQISCQILMHVSSEILNLRFEFETGQNRPVNRTKKTLFLLLFNLIVIGIMSCIEVFI